MLFGGTLILGSLVGLMLLWLLRSMENQKRARSLESQARQGLSVEVAQVTRSPTTRQIELIGEARPYLADNLYARVSGYLRQVNFDKGDRVSENQVLAVVESPETDKAYLAALADAQNKRRIAERMRKLLKPRLISPQEAEAAFASADIAQATLETQRVLRGYEQIRAPFDGIITSRLVDPGNLIQNASNSQSAQQLVATLSQTDRLRVYAYVDQKDATFIKVDDPAEIRLEERPDFHLEAQVSRVAGELDPKARKMLAEIDIPNTEQQIVSGSFVRVRITLNTPAYLELPVKALVFRDRKSMVGVIDADNTLHFRPIRVLSNDGEHLRIAEGVHEGERVAMDVGGSIQEGSRIQPRPLAAELHQAPPYAGAPASAVEATPRQQAGAAPQPGATSK